MAFTELRELRENMKNNEIAVFSTTYTYNNVNCYSVLSFNIRG